MGPSFLVLQQPAHHGGEEVRNLGRNAGGSLQPVHRCEERAKDVAHGIDQEQAFFGSQRHPVSFLAGSESKIITAWPPRGIRRGAVHEWLAFTERRAAEIHHSTGRHADIDSNKCLDSKSPGAYSCSSRKSVCAGG